MLNLKKALDPIDKELLYTICLLFDAEIEIRWNGRTPNAITYTGKRAENWVDGMSAAWWDL